MSDEEDGHATGGEVMMEDHEVIEIKEENDLAGQKVSNSSEQQGPTAVSTPAKKHGARENLPAADQQ